MVHVQDEKEKKKVSRSYKARSDINRHEPAKPAQICTTKETKISKLLLQLLFQALNSASWRLSLISSVFNSQNTERSMGSAAPQGFIKDAKSRCWPLFLPTTDVSPLTPHRLNASQLRAKCVLHHLVDVFKSRLIYRTPPTAQYMDSSHQATWGHNWSRTQLALVRKTWSLIGSEWQQGQKLTMDHGKCHWR